MYLLQGMHNIATAISGPPDVTAFRVCGATDRRKHFTRNALKNGLIVCCAGYNLCPFALALFVFLSFGEHVYSFAFFFLIQFLGSPESPRFVSIIKHQCNEASDPFNSPKCFCVATVCHFTYHYCVEF